jgi:AraC-like DNA-binding protein
VKHYVQPVFFAVVQRLAERGLAPFSKLPAEARARLTRPMTSAEATLEADALAQTTGDPTVGITVARSLGGGDLGLIEFLALSGPSWLHSIQRVVRFSALLNSSLVFSTHVSKGQVDFSERMPSRPEVMGRHINEFSVVSFIGLTRRSLGVGVPLSGAAVAHRDDTNREALTAALGVRPVFGAGENRLTISEADSARVPLQANAPLFQFLESEAKKRAPHAVAPTMAQLAERALEQGFVEARVGIETVAQSLHMSRRTLQRRLRDEGTTFEDLLDGLRRRLALQSLGPGKSSIAEVSFMLGYSDPRAFRRALKRWKQS